MQADKKCHLILNTDGSTSEVQCIHMDGWGMGAMGEVREKMI